MSQMTSDRAAQTGIFANKNAWIVLLCASSIAFYLALRSSALNPSLAPRLLLFAMVVGGLPMIMDVAKDLARKELGADALAVVAIVTALILKEYLAGTIIVLMLSGGALL